VSPVSSQVDRLNVPQTAMIRGISALRMDFGRVLRK
ncbi:MAG: hypothetical protein ACI97A_004091, partial [Planctomycetota bacterium]